MNYHLHQFSDLHFEFERDRGDSFCRSIFPDGIDGLILAGDIFPVKMGQDPIKRFLDMYPEVFYVLGNHEFYGMSPTQVFGIMREFEAKNPRLHLLNRNTATFHGHKIHGATLWFGDEHGDNFLYQNQLNDFRAIRDFSPWVYKENEESVLWFNDNIKKGDIVISHHLPAWHCIDPQWAGDPTNRFYANNLDKWVDRLSPSMWIHGHSHNHLDRVVGDVRFIRNPRGYEPYESVFKTGFEIDFMIDLEVKDEDSNQASE